VGVDQLVEQEEEHAADDGADDERIEGGVRVAMMAAVWVSESQHSWSDELDGQCGDQRTRAKCLQNRNVDGPEPNIQPDQGAERQ